jgi:hypothetical protein
MIKLTVETLRKVAWGMVPLQGSSYQDGIHDFWRRGMG